MSNSAPEPSLLRQPELPRVRPALPRPSLLLSGMLALVVVLGGCGGSTDDGAGAGAGSSDAESATITIADFSFGEALSVPVGTSVEVLNADGVGHTWTASDGTFDSGLLDPDATFEFLFDEAGTFTFFCEIHSSMTGSITVAP